MKKASHSSYIFSEVLNKKKLLIIEILNNVIQRYFYDVHSKGILRYQYQNTVFILSLHFFESKTELGHFDSNSLTLGLNQLLLSGPLSSPEIVTLILQHEFLHCIEYLTFRENISPTPHGNTFLLLGKKYSIPQKALRASHDLFLLEQLAQTSDQKESEYSQQLSLLSKIEKLMALSKNDNVHEAEVALEKAQKLLQQYQEQFPVDITQNTFEMRHILFHKKINHKIKTIISIISHFGVSVLISSGTEEHFVYILGPKSCVEVAEYLSVYLDRHLDALWNEERRKNPVQNKGLVAKNSFFFGIRESFRKKNLPQNTSSKNALISLKQKEDLLSLAFRDIETKTVGQSSIKINPDAFYAGQEAGNSLNLPKGIHSSQEKALLLD